jgi:hypothetical protein
VQDLTNLLILSASVSTATAALLLPFACAAALVRRKPALLRWSLLGFGVAARLGALAIVTIFYEYFQHGF